MCNSPISTETSGHSFDANQDEMMEKSTQEWNEQLEKEFFSGKCGSLLCSGIIQSCELVSENFLQKHRLQRYGSLLSSTVATFCCFHLIAECLV